jgi:metallo-beta-lactamase class B
LKLRAHAYVDILLLAVKHVETSLRSLITLLIAGISTGAAAASDSDLSLTHLRGPLYLVEDTHYLTTNSLVYIGTEHVTIIGATWTPATAGLLSTEVRKLTSLPITEVVVVSPDPEWAGGIAFWKSVGANVVAARVTCDLMVRNWTSTVEDFRKFRPSYPQLPLSLPTHCRSEDFQLQSGAIKTLFLGGSHTPGDIFVYFANERVLNAASILKEQLGNLAGADIQAYPETLRNLKRLNLDIDTVVSGHFSPLHGPELIDHYLQLLEDHKAQGGTN